MVESWFVHVTVVPTLTVIVAGEKAKLARVTELPVAVATEEVVVGAFPYPDPPEHASAEITASKDTTTNITGKDLLTKFFINNLPKMYFVGRCQLIPTASAGGRHHGNSDGGDYRRNNWGMVIIYQLD